MMLCDKILLEHSLDPVRDVMMVGLLINFFLKKAQQFLILYCIS